ncbi:hypothetical protein B0A55_00369 [Friedmanniomyces simplex]|uniref:Uncharacterized protein n=1 Tax=Friedmanniomyces simplex TaxID=329884 RepID=A0A4U0Y704_9PEZI|nr:hypothetical protein B0A55_00369 [Friedmanniomyces simplex]
MASSALAQSVGRAIVVNACEYEVYVCGVPAQGGGYTEIDKTLSPNGTFTQQWTELSNSQGWSIKLSKDTALANIMQYEYTFHNDGTIWYDLSDVNGNPWNSDWEITAESPSSTCTPKQQAYRYATDDAYGMQACPQDSVITVTLCSGESQNNGGAASASSSVAAATSSIASASSVSVYSTPSSEAPAPTSIESTTTTSAESLASTTPIASSTATALTTSAYSWRSHSWQQANAVATTLATSVVASSTTTTAPNGATVVDVETAVVTEIVTATVNAKRHAHHPHHIGA